MYPTNCRAITGTSRDHTSLMTMLSWNVTMMNENADAVAELMLQLHMSPASTMKGFLSLSGIEEAAGGEVSSAEAYSHVLADFEYLLDEVYAVKAAADEENQILVSNQMDDYIASLSKHNWMLRQVLK